MACLFLLNNRLSKGCDLADLPLDELQSFSAQISQDVYAVLTLEGSVSSRDHIGGTAPNQVKQAIKRARLMISD